MAEKINQRTVDFILLSIAVTVMFIGKEYDRRAVNSQLTEIHSELDVRLERFSEVEENIKQINKNLTVTPSQVYESVQQVLQEIENLKQALP